MKIYVFVRLFCQCTGLWGGYVTSNKKVYLLVSDGTGSAADGFAALLKENNLATLIGSNTGGEGLADSFMMDSLPNSGLVFIYTYSIAFGCDGLNNSVYGTSPDVYVNMSVDGFNKNSEMKKRTRPIHLRKPPKMG
jgi:C-terminal processing protease CtpA/Prc